MVQNENEETTDMGPMTSPAPLAFSIMAWTIVLSPLIVVLLM